jgi:hypothetical protein
MHCKSIQRVYGLQTLVCMCVLSNGVQLLGLVQIGLNSCDAHTRVLAFVLAWSTMECDNNHRQLIHVSITYYGAADNARKPDARYWAIKREGPHIHFVLPSAPRLVRFREQVTYS